MDKGKQMKKIMEWLGCRSVCNIDKAKAQARADVHGLWDGDSPISKEDIFRIINKIKVQR